MTSVDLLQGLWGRQIVVPPLQRRNLSDLPKAACYKATPLDGESALGPLAPYCLSSPNGVLHEAKCRVLESGDKGRVEALLLVPNA